MKTAPHDFKSSLVSLGLTDKEATVYVSLLELGRAGASKVAREAGVNRATGYVVLDTLIAKGLVRISGKEPTQEYEAESPDQLPATFRAERERAEENLKRAEALALKLKSIQKVETRPQVKFYEGKDGLKQVYEDTLAATSEIRAFGSYEVEEGELANYFPRYYARRAAKGIVVRGIAPRTPLAEARKKVGEAEKRELRLVPVQYAPKPEIDIYDNKVMIASWREKLGIIIESEEIADAMKKIFELAWERAKQLDTSIGTKSAL